MSDGGSEAGLPAAFRDIRVERVRKDDGRYLLYYSFDGPDEPKPAASPPPPARAEPWASESGPPDASGTADTPTERT